MCLPPRDRLRCNAPLLRHPPPLPTPQPHPATHRHNASHHPTLPPLIPTHPIPHHCDPVTTPSQLDFDVLATDPEDDDGGGPKLVDDEMLWLLLNGDGAMTPEGGVITPSRSGAWGGVEGRRAHVCECARARARSERRECACAVHAERGSAADRRSNTHHRTNPPLQPTIQTTPLYSRAKAICSPLRALSPTTNTCANNNSSSSSSNSSSNNSRRCWVVSQRLWI